jgi:DNA-binding transcriptional LysR family regulator
MLVFSIRLHWLASPFVEVATLRTQNSPRLVRPFSLSLPLSKTYWIICPKATASLPKIVTFRDWLLAEALSDLRQLQKKGRRAFKSGSPAR